MAIDNSADGLEEGEATPEPALVLPVSNRPPLLQLGGEENFVQYKAEFTSLYMNGFKDVRGKLIEFYSSVCKHVCYKTDEDNYDGGRRGNWSQERAEHIPWIGFVLTHPNVEIRPNKVVTRITYLLQVAGEPSLGLEQIFFMVVGEPQKSGSIVFVTAYPITHQKWMACRREGPAIWPIKPKKKKGS